MTLEAFVGEQLITSLLHYILFTVSFSSITVFTFFLEREQVDLVTEECLFCCKSCPRVTSIEDDDSLTFFASYKYRRSALNHLALFTSAHVTTTLHAGHMTFTALHFLPIRKEVEGQGDEGNTHFGNVST